MVKTKAVRVPPLAGLKPAAQAEPPEHPRHLGGHGARSHLQDSKADRWDYRRFERCRGYFGREAYDTLLSHAETGNFTRKVMLASHSEWSEFGTVNGARQVDPAGRFLGGNFRVADNRESWPFNRHKRVSRYESAQRPQVELIKCFALASANLEKGHRLETSNAKEFF